HREDFLPRGLAHAPTQFRALPQILDFFPQIRLIPGSEQKTCNTILHKFGQTPDSGANDGLFLQHRFHDGQWRHFVPSAAENGEPGCSEKSFHVRGRNLAEELAVWRRLSWKIRHT